MSTKKEWLERRRKGLGASDVAAALGFSPWRTPLEVWLEKTGSQIQVSSPNEETMEFGLAAEPAIKRSYSRMTGRTFVDLPAYEVVPHPNHKELFCTPDGITTDKRLVQAKWTRNAIGFGNPGTDDIPEHYAIQCAMEMACCGINLEDLAVYQAGPPVLVYPLVRNYELERELIVAAVDWWHTYVTRGVEPPIDSSQQWASYLGKKWPLNKGQWLDADKDQNLREDLERYLQSVRLADEASANKELLKSSLKDRIADRDGIRWQGGQISWRKDKDSTEEQIDYQMVLTELSVKHKIPIFEMKELITRHTSRVVTRKGTRKFILMEK